jgi:hypothetical protein
MGHALAPELVKMFEGYSGNARRVASPYSRGKLRETPAMRRNWPEWSQLAHKNGGQFASAAAES